TFCSLEMVSTLFMVSNCVKIKRPKKGFLKLAEIRDQKSLSTVRDKPSERENDASCFATVSKEPQRNRAAILLFYIQIYNNWIHFRTYKNAKKIKKKMQRFLNA